MKPTLFDKLLVRCRRETKGKNPHSFILSIILNHMLPVAGNQHFGGKVRHFLPNGQAFQFTFCLHLVHKKFTSSTGRFYPLHLLLSSQPPPTVPSLPC